MMLCGWNCEWFDAISSLSVITPFQQKKSAAVNQHGTQFELLSKRVVIDRLRRWLPAEVMFIWTELLQLVHIFFFHYFFHI